jgi:hypothetical protein
MPRDRRNMPETAADTTEENRSSLAGDLARAAKKAVTRGGGKVERLAKRFTVKDVNLYTCFSLNSILFVSIITFLLQ